MRVFRDSAFRDAKALDKEAREGNLRGLLHGVPYAAKDLIRVYDRSAEAIPGQGMTDAIVIRLLREAGLVLLGKTTTYELAMGPPSFNDAIPPARNPWNIDHIPGGSSSGSAAGAAASLCSLALGTDTGGSVRHPAAFCGVVGLKPSYGAISLEGVIPLSWTLDALGVLSRSSRDAAAVLEILAPALSRPLRARSEASRSLPSRPLLGITVLVPRDFIAGSYSISPDVLAEFRRSIDALASLGANIDERELHIRGHEAVLSVILLSEAAAYHREHLLARPQDFGESLRERMAPGYLFAAVDYIKAQALRVEIIAKVDAAFETVDVIATPTMPAAAPSFEGFARMSKDLAPPPFTSLFSLTGHPAVSVPSGWTSSGLPVGLQLATRRNDDFFLLQVAEAFEQVSSPRASVW